MSATNSSLSEAKTLLAAMAAETADLNSALAAPVTDTVAGWLVSQYACAAHEKLTDANKANRWEILRAIVQDVALLRRGDHSAARLQLEREHLDLQKANSEAQKEKDFWEWLKRPEIHKKVFPDERRGISKETLEKIERELGLL